MIKISRGYMLKEIVTIFRILLHETQAGPLKLSRHFKLENYVRPQLCYFSKYYSY